MLAASLRGASASLGLKRSGLAAASISLTKPTVCASAQMCKRIRIPKYVMKKNIKSSKRDRRSREVVGPKLSHPRATHVHCRLPRRQIHDKPRPSHWLRHTQAVPSFPDPAAWTRTTFPKRQVAGRHVAARMLQIGRQQIAAGTTCSSSCKSVAVAVAHFQNFFVEACGIIFEGPLSSVCSTISRFHHLIGSGPGGRSITTSPTCSPPPDGSQESLLRTSLQQRRRNEACAFPALHHVRVALSGLRYYSQMSSTSPLPPPASASPTQTNPSILPTQAQEQGTASRTHSSDGNAAEMAEVTSRFAFQHHTNQPHDQHRYASSDYEPYPLSSRSTPRSPRSRRSSSTSSTLQWLTRLFIRSPKSISDKRDYLLPKSKSSSRSSSLSRRSTDLESQASTLLGLDERLSKSGSSGKTRIDPRVISDAIIGLSDGLTVPFALTAGLSTMGSTKVVIFAGLAELTAGAISMGLGGYLAAKSEE